MIESKNKFFDYSKLPEISTNDILLPKVSYIDIFPETQVEQISGNTERKRYKLRSGSISLDPLLLGAIDIMNLNPNLRNKYRITSTVRQARYTGDKSNHITGLAFDIVPIDGDFTKLQLEIAKDSNLINYLQNNNLGIIVEVGPEARKKYKATGDNLHFGPDPAAIAGLSLLISLFRV